MNTQLENLEKIKKEFLDKLRNEQRRIIATLAVAVIASLVAIVAQLYPEALLWLFIVSVSLLLFFCALLATFIIFKPLFFVGAELSLIIFIAQSYCEIPNRTPNADNALKVLVVSGLIYVFAHFVKSTYKLLKELEEKQKSRKIKMPWFVYMITGAFFGSFGAQLYLVVSPIILNLCVYR